MSDAPEVEKLEVPGSCHCGSIKYIASGVDLSKATKCNCSICLTSGRIGITADPASITITTTPSGKPETLTYGNGLETSLWPEELVYYSPGVFKGEVEKGKEHARHYFCKVCGVRPFIIANIPSYGEMTSINILNLDLKSVGKDLKVVTDPKTMKYARGSDNTWATNVGEAWPHSAW